LTRLVGVLDSPATVVSHSCFQHFTWRSLFINSLVHGWFRHNCLTWKWAPLPRRRSIHTATRHVAGPTATTTE
jgi:hypothetical protein